MEHPQKLMQSPRPIIRSMEGGGGAFVKGSRSSVREVTSYNYSTNYRGDTPESDGQQRYTVLTFRMAGNHESDQLTRFITLGQALTNNKPLMLAMGNQRGLDVVDSMLSNMFALNCFIMASGDC